MSRHPRPPVKKGLYVMNVPPSKWDKTWCEVTRKFYPNGQPHRMYLRQDGWIHRKVTGKVRMWWRGSAWTIEGVWFTAPSKADIEAMATWAALWLA